MHSGEPKDHEVFAQDDSDFPSACKVAGTCRWNSASL